MQARTEVINDAVSAVADQAILAVPSAMVDRQVEDDIQRLRQELSRDDMAFDEFLRFGGKTMDDYKAEIRPDAERRLRNSLVLEAFAKTEGVEVTDEDLEAEIDRLTSASAEAQQMREIYANPYFSQMIRDELANRKVADRLIEIVTEGVGAVTGEGAEALKEATSVETQVIEGEPLPAEESADEGADEQTAQRETEVVTEPVDQPEAVEDDADEDAALDASDATSTQTEEEEPAGT